MTVAPVVRLVVLTTDVVLQALRTFRVSTLLIRAALQTVGKTDLRGPFSIKSLTYPLLHAAIVALIVVPIVSKLLATTVTHPFGYIARVLMTLILDAPITVLVVATLVGAAPNLTTLTVSSTPRMLPSTLRNHNTVARYPRNSIVDGRTDLDIQLPRRSRDYSVPRHYTVHTHDRSRWRIDTSVQENSHS